MESKKGVLWKILKWIGRAVFAIFILSLVYFQAPIKVIGFFLIFLLAGIFLRKPYYKYFWLIVLAVVIGLTVWVFLPEDDNGWKPFAFEKDIQALNDKYAVPDNENAALIYNEIFADSNDKDLDPNISNDVDLDTMDNPWTAEQYPELAQWLKAKEPLIEKLKQAAEKEKCFFEIDPNSFFELKTSGLFRQLIYLLVRKANNDIANGDIDTAIADLAIAMQIANHNYQQPMLPSYLVGIALDSVTRLKIADILINQKLTDEQYDRIFIILDKNKFLWRESFVWVIEYKRLCFKKIFCLLYETKDGKYRFVRDGGLRAIKYYSMSQRFDNIQLTYFEKKRMKAKTISMWFFLPSTPDSFCRKVDNFFDEYLASGKIPEFQLNLTCENLVAMIYETHNFEKFDKTSETFYRYNENREGSLLLLKISKFKNQNGKLPWTLQERIKAGLPFERFVYKPIDETNFILYSIGNNGIDDGGKGKTGYRGSDSEKFDDLLIWPITKCGTR